MEKRTWNDDVNIIVRSLEYEIFTSIIFRIKYW